MKELISYSKTLKILYVEDNEEARNQTFKLLSNFFKEIDIAKDGKEGLLKYVRYHDDEQRYYDLVISDINMPNMDGIEMGLQILSLNNQQPILMISAHNESEKLQKLMDIGVNQYIHKPIDNKIFLDKLSKMIKLIQNRKNQEKHMTEIEKLNHELDALIDSFDTYVIASRTDLKGIITYSSKAYETISGYKAEELIGKPHSIVRHPDMPKSAFRDLWNTIKSEKLWIGEVKNLKKDGSYYWVKAYIAPYYNKNKKHIGYSAIRIDITAQKEVEELNEQISALLNNAGEGFLSFDKNFVCQSGFSKECLDIFDVEDIIGLDISELLFKNNMKDKELFKEGIKNIVKSEDLLSRELILSLLPHEQNIAGKIINIKYKILDSDRFMLILLDVTKTKQLEEKIKNQKKIKEMIISVASNQNEFLELKLDFESFILNPPENKKKLLQALHTYKGIFAQKNMLFITEAIHNLESKINQERKNIDTIFKEIDLQNIFDKDLQIIEKNLGKEFLNDGLSLKIDAKQVDKLIKKIENLSADDFNEKDMEEIKNDLYKFRFESVYNMLKEYPRQVKNIAEKLEKLVYPLEIKGDKNIILPPKFKPFMKSLIHLFNNSLDHGIEDMETRANSGKDEIGLLVCEYKKKDDKLILEISGDGAGINVPKLVSSAIKNGIKSKDECDKMSEAEKLELIFAEKISTKDNVSMISGRGVGMGAIKEEMLKLGGILKIKNRVGQGVKFSFVLPAK